MADTKISALTGLTALAVGDFLVVVDISDITMAATGTNKKITVADLFTSPALTTPSLGTPTAGVLTSCTGLPPTTGIVGWPANSSGVLTNNGSGTLTWTAAGGTGTVTDVSVVTANGVSGSVATSTTTPAITLTLGAITPSTIVATSTISATTGFKIGGAAGSRKILVGDGTNFVASTETYAVPGTSGNVLTSDGTNWTSAAPAGGGITVGTTTIASGTTTRVLFDNAGVVGEYPVTGSTNVVMSASPVLTGTITLASANHSVGGSAPVLFGADGQLWSNGTNVVGIGSVNSAPTSLFLTASGSTPITFIIDLTNPIMVFRSGTGIGYNAAGVVEVNDGTAGQWGSLKAGVRDAGTATITDALTIGHQSTGTPAAGLGTAVQFNLNSSTTADQNAARMAALWTDATHATRTAAIVFYTVNSAAALAEVVRFAGNGGVTMASLAGTGSRAVVADANGLLSAPVSDELMKEPLRPLPESYGIEMVNKLEPSLFKYRDRSRFGDQDYLGFGARATAKVLPEVTGQDRDGTYYLTDEKLTAVLVKAVQQLSERLDQLEKERIKWH